MIAADLAPPENVSMDIVDSSAVTETPTPSNEFPSPVVFQCSQCKTIVGDSSSIVSMDPQRRTMSIKRRADTIEVDPALNTSTDEFDFGSTFHVFGCASCKRSLGQVYRTTSAKLDNLRELFTYHSDNITFYQLTADPDILLEETAENMTEDSLKKSTVDGVPQDTTSNPGPTINGAMNVANSELEIVKLQKFCLHLLERVQKLESQQKKPSKSSNNKS